MAIEETNIYPESEISVESLAPVEEPEMDTDVFVRTYLSEGLQHLGSLMMTEANNRGLSLALKAIDRCRKDKKRIFIIGNGGSASTAQHLTSDLNKWATGDGQAPVRAICLNDNMSSMTALTNDDGWENVYDAQLNNLEAEAGDVIIAISVHGGKGSDAAGVWSQNLTKAIANVKEHGGYAVGITGFDGGAMAELCDAHINVPAESTPHVEGLHLVVTHCIVDGLRVLAMGNYQEK